MVLKAISAVCILLFLRIVRAAAILLPNNFAGFAFTSGFRGHSTRSYKRRVVAAWVDIEPELANQIEDTRSSAGMVTESERADEDATQEFRSNRRDDTNSDDTDRSTNIEAFERSVMRPPEALRRNKVKIPPHTALAQVLANQYGIDLASVPTSSGEPGSKITAEDVEYHAWMVAQPPCTAEALKMAYSLSLDLNSLYDDDDREYVMSTADIQLYVENSRSLNMSTQTVKKGTILDNNSAQSSKKRIKQMKALDKRMEQNMAMLLDKTQRLAKTLTGGIIQQAQLQVLSISRSSINDESVSRKGFVNMMGENANVIHSIRDFDVNLANVIQEALSTAGKSSTPTTRDIIDGKGGISIINDELASEKGFVKMMGENVNDVHSIEDFDVNLANVIQEALSAAGESSPPTTKQTFYGEGAESSLLVAGTFSIENELPSMTCAQLKERLRLRGMKVSGKKADLVERLLFGCEDNGAINHNHNSEGENENDDDDDGNVDNIPFFATLR
ncbi:hypothetical protein ACHAXA_003653 [Cyclostephanos tholiformis]|uniref:SAP domain-containing protein n=1 Tax=Cyclostephanos tholiformis TaxID=382380 RepID=A0ABD3SP05_9STRA